jgi:hypothetical protein
LVNLIAQRTEHLRRALSVAQNNQVIGMNRELAARVIEQPMLHQTSEIELVCALPSCAGDLPGNHGSAKLKRPEQWDAIKLVDLFEQVAGVFHNSK